MPKAKRISIIIIANSTFELFVEEKKLVLRDVVLCKVAILVMPKIIFWQGSNNYCGTLRAKNPSYTCLAHYWSHSYLDKFKCYYILITIFLLGSLLVNFFFNNGILG